MSKEHNTPYDPDFFTSMLDDLFRHFALPLDRIGDTYKTITTHLRELRTIDPGWGHKYTHQVHHQKMEKPGKIFLLAILKLHKKTFKDKPKKPNKRLSTNFSSVKRKDMVLNHLTNAQRDEILYNAALLKGE